jgi:hypothetical protein
MTKIYSQASRVIIWLGEGTDNSDQAFEGIRNAAEDEVTDSLEETNQEAILKLLERPWFRRIWVREPIFDNLCGKALKHRSRYFRKSLQLDAF